MSTPALTDEEAAAVEPAALTPAEVAAAMRVHYNTALRLIKSGEIPHFKIGNHYRVPPDALRAAMARMAGMDGAA